MLVNFHMFLLTVLGVALLGAGAIGIGARQFGAGLLIASGIIALVAAFAGNRTSI